MENAGSNFKCNTKSLECLFNSIRTANHLTVLMSILSVQFEIIFSFFSRACVCLRPACSQTHGVRTDLQGVGDGASSLE